MTPLEVKKVIESVTVDEVLNIYDYGSHVYGTNDELSDRDYIVIVKDNFEAEYMNGINEDLGYDGKTDVTIYSESKFQEALDNHEVEALECLWLPQNNIHMELRKFKAPKIDNKKLRDKFSSKASNSFVKAKKKLTVEEDCVRIGLKSLFHSFRILAYGCQIGIIGAITDYNVTNYIWDEIKHYDDWSMLEHDLQIKYCYNKLKSEFKLSAPYEKGIE